jgi:hypothetical protein
MAKRKKKKPTDIVPLMLRLREELRERLAIEAFTQERSLNNEIVRRLEQSFEVEKTSALIEMAKTWNALADKKMAEVEEIYKRAEAINKSTLAALERRIAQDAESKRGES